VKFPLRLYRFAPPLCLSAELPVCALTIGNFDGVHRGHQAILKRLTAEAAARGLTPAVMTFEPHPRDYFALRARRPELAPTRICSLRDKITALARHGVAGMQIATLMAGVILLLFGNGFAVDGGNGLGVCGNGDQTCRQEGEQTFHELPFWVCVRCVIKLSGFK